MNHKKIIKELDQNSSKNTEVLVTVNCLDDMEEEDAILYSLAALFKRGLKQNILYNLKTIELIGPVDNIKTILSNPSNHRFFEKVDFSINTNDITV